MILESPVFPVAEGDEVTLRCSYKEMYAESSTSNFSTKFYKDGYFIGIQPAGLMTIKNVEKSHQGLYKCEYPSKGESLQSLLAVKGDDGTLNTASVW